MPHILLAEDDTSMRHFIQTALVKAGHTVTACEDGQTAFEALTAPTAPDAPAYDLLLTDIIMPGMDGIELSQKAAAHRPELKVMFITGFSGTALGSKNTEEIQAQTLSKPFHLNELMKRIEDLLTG